MGPFCWTHATEVAEDARRERGALLQIVDDPDHLPDTRYPVSWWSESKGKLVTLESMHDQHLMNAYEKFGRILNYNPVFVRELPRPETVIEAGPRWLDAIASWHAETGLADIIPGKGFPVGSMLIYSCHE